MNTTSSQLPQAPPRSASAAAIARRQRMSGSPDHPTWRERLDETAPIFDVPAFYGPPIIFLLGPWLLLVLLLIGPFALILTLLLVLAVAAGLLAALVAVIASPYLLARHMHARGSISAPRLPTTASPNYDHSRARA